MQHWESGTPCFSSAGYRHEQNRRRRYLLDHIETWIMELTERTIAHLIIYPDGSPGRVETGIHAEQCEGNDDYM
jgi:hypothetical protein